MKSVAIGSRWPLGFWSGCGRELGLSRAALVFIDDNIFDALILMHVCPYLIREISVLTEQLRSASQIQPFPMMRNDVDNYLVGDQVFYVSLVTSSLAKEDVCKVGTLNSTF